MRRSFKLLASAICGALCAWFVYLIGAHWIAFHQILNDQNVTTVFWGIIGMTTVAFLGSTTLCYRLIRQK